MICQCADAARPCCMIHHSLILKQDSTDTGADAKALYRWAKPKRKEKAPQCELRVQLEAACVKVHASVLNFSVSSISETT